MDPNACLDLLLVALRDAPHDADRGDDAEEHAENLVEWLNRGGFRPRPSALEEIRQEVENGGLDLEDFFRVRDLLSILEG